jgi:hypothetical protein
VAGPHAPARLDVTVDARLASGERTIAEVSPPLEQDRHSLVWRSRDDVLPTIFLLQFDQQADDRARNGFFGIAILLGMAGACLLAVVQSIVRPLDRT